MHACLVLLMLSFLAQLGHFGPRRAPAQRVGHSALGPRCIKYHKALIRSEQILHRYSAIASGVLPRHAWPQRPKYNRFGKSGSSMLIDHDSADLMDVQLGPIWKKVSALPPSFVDT